MKKILSIIIGLILISIPTALAADNFSGNHVQGIFGEFKPVLDETVSFSQDNVQGVFGQFIPVLDESAGAVAPTPTPTAPVEADDFLQLEY